MTKRRTDTSLYLLDYTKVIKMRHYSLQVRLLHVKFLHF